MDLLTRNVLTQGERSLDLGQVIRDKKILIFDMPIYTPFRADNVALLARLFVNDLHRPCLCAPAFRTDTGVFGD